MTLLPSPGGGHYTENVRTHLVLLPSERMASSHLCRVRSEVGYASLRQLAPAGRFCRGKREVRRAILRFMRGLQLGRPRYSAKALRNNLFACKDAQSGETLHGVWTCESACLSMIFALWLLSPAYPEVRNTTRLSHIVPFDRFLQLVVQNDGTESRWMEATRSLNRETRVNRMI